MRGQFKSGDTVLIEATVKNADEGNLESILDDEGNEIGVQGNVILNVKVGKVEFAISGRQVVQLPAPVAPTAGKSQDENAGGAETDVATAVDKKSKKA